MEGKDMFENMNGQYVQLNDRFESVHVWSKEIAIRNEGRWIPILISKEKYDQENKSKSEKQFIGYYRSIMSPEQLKLSDLKEELTRLQLENKNLKERLDEANKSAKKALEMIDKIKKLND